MTLVRRDTSGRLTQTPVLIPGFYWAEFPKSKATTFNQWALNQNRDGVRRVTVRETEAGTKDDPNSQPWVLFEVHEKVVWPGPSLGVWPNTATQDTHKEDTVQKPEDEETSGGSRIGATWLIAGITGALYLLSRLRRGL